MENKVHLKNGKELLIRNLTDSDYKVVCNFLCNISMQTIFTNQYPGQPDKDEQKAKEMYENNDNCFFAVFDADQIIGLASAQIIKHDHPWCGRNAYFGISILENFQNQGLGTKLMQEIEEWCRYKKMHRIFGTVRHKNTKAIGLYLKCGFFIDGLSRETAFIDGEWHHEYNISKILD